MTPRRTRLERAPAAQRTKASGRRRRLLAGLAVAGASVAAAIVPATASAGLQYASGLNPEVTNDESGPPVIEVHQSGVGTGPLWYRLGVCGPSATGWTTGSYQFDTGTAPSVAIADGLTAIEVHQASDSPGPLWYSVGVGAFAGTSPLSWGASQQYASGLHPSVAVTGGAVVEVHQAVAGVGSLWYRVGRVNSNTKSVTWGPSRQYDVGTSPSIALSGGVYVLEAHQAGDGIGPLWYRVGYLDPTGNVNTPIDWGPSHEYAVGEAPSVSIYDQSHIREVHMTVAPTSPYPPRIGSLPGPSPSTAPTLWMSTGDGYGGPDRYSVAWSASRAYDQGLHPSIASCTTANRFVEVHQGLTGQLWSDWG